MAHIKKAVRSSLGVMMSGGEKCEKSKQGYCISWKGFLT